MHGASARPCTGRRQRPSVVGVALVCGAGSVYGYHTRQCIMAGNAREARAFLGRPVCTGMVLRNLSDMEKVHTPRNIIFRTNISVICVDGNARDPRAFH